MKAEYTDQFKTNDSGDLDVNYYIAKGRQLRAEAVAAMVRGLFAKLGVWWVRRCKSQHLPLKMHFRH